MGPAIRKPPGAAGPPLPLMLMANSNSLKAYRKTKLFDDKSCEEKIVDLPPSDLDGSLFQVLS
jgi:hypothetical protein